MQCFDVFRIFHLPMTWPSGRARLVFARLAVATVLAAFIIILTFRTGIERGMHQAVTIGLGDEIAVTIALSESVYRVKLGYLGLTPVFNKLEEYWHRGAPGWSNIEVLKRNFRDPKLLNEGIRAAASMGPQTPGYIADGTLITTYYDDMGQVDFVKLAFLLFGLEIQSLYYLYFTLLAVSAFVFIVTFKSNIYALGLLLCTLFAYYLELYLAVFDSVAVPNYAGLRHGSTLGLVPMWHFVFLLLLRRSPSRVVVVAAMIQLAILILAWRIRGSVSWMFLFAFLVAFTLALRETGLRQARPAWAWPDLGSPLKNVFAFLGSGVKRTFSWWRDVARSWPVLVRETLRWPVVLLIIGMMATGIYNRVALHAIYFTDDVMPYHGLWHSAYLGLSYTPDILSPAAAAVAKSGDTRTDYIGYVGSMQYLNKIHFMRWSHPGDAPPTFLSPWTGNLVKARLHDNIMRRAFFKAVLKHPLSALEIYVIRKPPLIYESLKSAFTRAPDRTWLWLMLAAGAALFVMLATFAREADCASTRVVLLAGAGAVLAGGLPNMWAYPGVDIMADMILAAASFVPLLLGMGSFALLTYVRNKWRSVANQARL